MKNLKLLAILSVLVLVIPVVYSLKASIGNARAVVYVNSSPEDPAIIDRTILVRNKNEIPVKVTVAVDEKYKDFVEVHDPEVILDPEGYARPKYTVTWDRGGTFEIRFNVAFLPADAEEKDNSVGLLSTLVVVSQGPVIEDGKLDPKEPEPEETVEPEPEETVEPETVETDEPEPEDDEEDDTVSVSLGRKDPVEETDPVVEEKTDDKVNPMVGIIIVAIIVAVGLGAFYIITKK